MGPRPSVPTGTPGDPSDSSGARTPFPPWIQGWSVSSFPPGPLSLSPFKLPEFPTCCVFSFLNIGWDLSPPRTPGTLVCSPLLPRTLSLLTSHPSLGLSPLILPLPQPGCRFPLKPWLGPGSFLTRTQACVERPPSLDLGLLLQTSLTHAAASASFGMRTESPSLPSWCPRVLYLSPSGLAQGQFLL